MEFSSRSKLSIADTRNRTESLRGSNHWIDACVENVLRKVKRLWTENAEAWWSMEWLTVVSEVSDWCDCDATWHRCVVFVTENMSHHETTIRLHTHTHTPSEISNMGSPTDPTCSQTLAAYFIFCWPWPLTLGSMCAKWLLWTKLICTLWIWCLSLKLFSF